MADDVPEWLRVVVWTRPAETERRLLHRVEVTDRRFDPPVFAWVTFGRRWHSEHAVQVVCAEATDRPDATPADWLRTAFEAVKARPCPHPIANRQTVHFER